MQNPLQQASLSSGRGHEPSEHQVHEAHTSWQRAWADSSQASAQSGAGLKVSRGPEGAAAPQQGTASCRAPSPALGAGRSRPATGQLTSCSQEGKRDPAVPEELGQAKASRWVLYEEGNSLPSLLPSSPKLAQNQESEKPHLTRGPPRDKTRPRFLSLTLVSICSTAILQHSPSTGQKCPRRGNPRPRAPLGLRVTEPRRIPPGACSRNRHVVPSSCRGPDTGAQGSTVKGGEEHAVEEKRIIWNHLRCVCNNNPK